MRENQSRIVVKCGSSLLMQNNGGIHTHCFYSLAEQVSELIDRGIQIVLVASGAIAMGRSVLPENNEGGSTLARQVLAAVGQGPLMAEFTRSFSEFDIDVAQALLSRGSLNQRDGYLNARNTLLELMQRNIVTIVNENDVVATEELQFGDNDRLAALVANLVDAELLVMLTDVDGYLCPDDQGQLQVVPVINHVSQEMLKSAGGAGSETGTGGMRTKLEAAALAMSHGTRVVIGPGRVEGSLRRIVAGEPIGTTFLPTGDRRESRKRWMLTDLSLKGQIIVDAGAARALLTDGRSLLPAGIIGYEGTFGRGDLVAVLSPDGITIGHGLSNYRVGDIEAIAGSDSRDIREILGYEYGAEVIHRNNFAIVGSSATA